MPSRYNYLHSSSSSGTQESRTPTTALESLKVLCEPGFPRIHHMRYSQNILSWKSLLHIHPNVIMILIWRNAEKNIAAKTAMHVSRFRCENSCFSFQTKSGPRSTSGVVMCGKVVVSFPRSVISFGYSIFPSRNATERQHRRLRERVSNFFGSGAICIVEVL